MIKTNIIIIVDIVRLTVSISVDKCSVSEYLKMQNAHTYATSNITSPKTLTDNTLLSQFKINDPLMLISGAVA